MKVLLKKDVDNLGYSGEIFEVAAGYGRNFLIPNGYAIPATGSAVRQAAKWIEQAAARREQLRQEYAALAARLTGTILTFTASAGGSGRLYGSITTAEIAEKLNAEMGLEVSRKKISVEGKAIRQTGNHPAVVRLDAEFQATIRIMVVAEGGGDADADATEDAVEGEEVDAEAVTEEAEEMEAAVEEMGQEDA